MTEQLVVNVNRYETRVAVLEGSDVTEVFIERHDDRGIVGNIYLGKVQRVLPGMQAAFVEIGLNKAAFLYVGDVVQPPRREEEKPAATLAEAAAAAEEGAQASDLMSRPGPKPMLLPGDAPDSQAADVTLNMKVGPSPMLATGPTLDTGPVLETEFTATVRPGRSRPGPKAYDADLDATDDTVEIRAGVVVPRPDDVAQSDAGARRERRKRHRGRSDVRIEQVLKQGQNVLVQVAKGAIGSKGPRVTCNVSLPGRHLVFMPMHDHIGVSRRITDEDERARLKQVLESVRPPEGGGFVVRTVSAGLSEETLRDDAQYLVTLWHDLLRRSQTGAPPMLVQPEHNLMLRCARDYFTEEISRVVIDDEAAHDELSQFMKLRAPALQGRIERYEKTEPIFQFFGVEAEIDRAMSRKVWLKSGGYLVIDQAEALTAIDVNTGRFVGKRNLEDTVLKTNLEAIKEVAAQLRFRNIGGMVIIDFIDMEVPDHRQRVLDDLDHALQKDRARCHVVKMSELGLVEMTRQRTRESLGRQLTETCWYCEGRGVLKSKRTIVYDIFRALEQQAPTLGEPMVVVQAHPEVADLMLDGERDLLEQIQEECGREIVVRPRGSFHQEQFDIFGTSAGSLAKNTRAVTEG